MGVKIIVKNKRAFYDYFISERVEAGLSLVGTEVKSLRAGKASIAEAYINIDKNNEAWVVNMRIPHYEQGNIHNHNETRRRKLLLHAAEIKKLKHESQAKSLTIVTLALYFKKSHVKLEIGLAKGKKLHDKRQTEAKRDAERRIKKLV